MKAKEQQEKEYAEQVAKGKADKSKVSPIFSRKDV
jgi:hypothetical protein